MKKFFLFVSFFILPMVFVFAQTMSVQVSGTVTSDSTGAPVAGHTVIIMADSSSGFFFYTTRTTGVHGLYDCTIQEVPTATPVTFTVYTQDCNNVNHQESFLSTNSPAVVNFVICTQSVHCESKYVFYQDSTNQMRYHFYSTSIIPAGTSVTSYNWNFGDSTEHAHTMDPWHTFLHTGTYNVCLTIVTSSGCTSTRCDTIVVGEPPVNCESWFTYSKNMLTVSFEGHTHSTHPASWAWNFGDPASGTNNTSNLQFPTHVYSQQGSYHVVLQTADSTGCSFTSDQNVYVYNTVDLYGFVHAATNPVDHGYIELIRVDTNNVMTVVDSREFGDSAGMYWFGGVQQGHYFLKAELLPSSAYYGQYAPTYYQEALNWTGADLIELGNPQNPYNFGLKHVNGPLSGSGNISGVITSGAKVNSGGIPAANVEVLLLDESDAPLAYRKTDGNGHFEFPGVAMGVYTIWPEVAGLTTNPAHITLTEATPSMVLPFNLTTANVAYGLNDNLPPGFNYIGEVYPNPPADGKVRIAVSVTRDMNLELILYNQLGQVLSDVIASVHTGSNQVGFNMGILAKGSYYLQLRSPEGGMAVRKLTVKD